MYRKMLIVLAVLAGNWADNGWSQGVLIITDHPGPLPRVYRLPQPAPQPAFQYSVKELSVEGRITDQVARVQVSQTFVNSGSSPIQAQFLFPLPYDGAIDKLTLLVDGKEFPAQLLSKEEARRRYEAIVRANRDPALLEWMGRGMFQTSVFPIPAGAERKVVLEYNQLLRKHESLTELLFPLGTARFSAAPLQKLNVRFSIESGVDIKSVYSPTHPVDVQRSDARHAVVSYTRENDIPAGDFRLFFDIQPGPLATSVLSYHPDDGEDGYFLLLTSPEIARPDAVPAAKTVVFVVDKSGSMSGKKMEQARQALKFVLNNLREGDLFNIIAYDSEVASFRPELERLTDQTRQAATSFVDGLYSGGGTNIHGALTAALSQLNDERRPEFVLFLTDGLPTVGETNESRVAAAVKDANHSRVRILSFGVGYDVNSRLLDRISRDNSGASEYVRPEDDIEVAVSNVYHRIGSPLMTDVRVEFQFDAAAGGPPAVNRVYPAGTFDLFAGDQVVVVGRYHQTGAAKVKITGIIDGQQQTFDFPAELTAKSRDQSLIFVEKLWAVRRIGEIIDRLDLDGQNKELVDELVSLSTRYGILTPYTSFLADENVRPDVASAANQSRALGSVERFLTEADGRGGVAQRSSKQAFKAAARPSSVNEPASGPAASTENLRRLSSGRAYYQDALTDAAVVVESVRNSGNQALYKRGKLLVTPETANLDFEQQADQITVVPRYSESYFDLVAANSPDENQLLSSQQDDEELLVRLRGKAYLIK